MQENVLTDPELYNPDNIKKRAAKVKPGFVQSIKVVFSSGYVAKIAIMVVGYGMVINFMVCDALLIWLGNLLQEHP
jgi:ATP/ADP translocase